MYEYKFVRLHLKPGLLHMKPERDYHQLIEQTAAQGWRLLQIFAPNASAHSNASYFELIFEREKRALPAEAARGDAVRA